MSREFVDSIVSGNNIEAETEFKNSISTKVGDALEIKRKEYSKTFVSNSSFEEVEEEVEIEDEEFEEGETSEGAVKGAVIGGIVGGPAGAAVGAAIGQKRRRLGKDRFSKKALKKQQKGKKLSPAQVDAAKARKKTLAK